MKSYDDVSPIQFNTGLGGPLCMEWANSRQLLAVAGVANHTDNNDYVNILKCYTDTGELLYSTLIPYSQVSENMIYTIKKKKKNLKLNYLFIF